jgi:hypothetical protein
LHDAAWKKARERFERGMKDAKKPFGKPPEKKK